MKTANELNLNNFKEKERKQDAIRFHNAKEKALQRTSLIQSICIMSETELSLFINQK